VREAGDHQHGDRGWLGGGIRHFRKRAVAILERMAFDDGDRQADGPVTTSQVLSTLARDAIDLFSGPLADRIRTCAADDCGMFFVDQSRPGTRRWCSMQRCGTLAKVRAHRARNS
jgi:predicted RNA-binding Zn ribbon-like protein